MTDRNKIEKSLVLLTWDPSIDASPLSTLAKHVVDADFDQALVKTDFAQKIFTPAFLDDALRSDLPETSSSSLEDSLTRLILGIAALHAFVQLNWTGPDLDFSVCDVLRMSSDSRSPHTEEPLHQKAIALLALGGEPAYHLAKSAMLLVVARTLFAQVAIGDCPSVALWRMRVATIQQHLLDEPAPLPPTSTIVSDVQALKATYSMDAEPELVARLELELGLLEHTMRQDKTAGEYFVRAARSSGMEYELTGAMGRRTKFQQTDLTQLVLLAESRLKFTEDDVTKRTATDVQPEPEKIPETLALNDDTLLEQTAFTTSSPAAHTNLAHLAANPGEQPALHPIDQCILLSMCLNVKNTSPVHGLTAEQMTPYVARVISHPQNWSVHTMALLLRARLEANRTRTVERATLQLQALVEQMPTTDSTVAPAKVRLRFVHALPLPSKWEMERELAERFLSLGIIRSALEIFERLEMWEEVVRCWQALEKRDQGVRIVRGLLEGTIAEADVVVARGKQGTSDTHRTRMDRAREAKLWCLLGDLEPENAVEHYTHAWTLSGETAGRAMRSLGGYHFAHAQYADAIECLTKAVAINPLLTRSWFVLGCAHMREEHWEDARAAFKSVPFENKLLAFRALKQGLRAAYENWRMWYNYMIVAMDVGELSEAARALGRVVDMHGADGLDIDVVEKLVDAVTRGDSDAAAEDAANQPNSGRALYRPVMHLLEDIVLPRISTSPRVFRAYARLLRWSTPPRWADALKASMDAYRCGVAAELEADGGAATATATTEQWRDAVGEVTDIVDALRNFGPLAEDVGTKWKGQARSVVRSFMSANREVFGEEKEWAQLEEMLVELRRKDDD
ncbi:hypothetical protein MKEN_00876400 [Mycena kentingensis (nom. inval.)]|nr:hypothetical protein MKEN_00876400 [Mycena kentingensis (nom. inval.)]